MDRREFAALKRRWASAQIASCPTTPDKYGRDRDIRTKAQAHRVVEQLGYRVCASIGVKERIDALVAEIEAPVRVTCTRPSTTSPLQPGGSVRTPEMPYEAVPGPTGRSFP